MSIQAVIGRIQLMRDQLKNIIRECEKTDTVSKRIIDDLKSFEEKFVELLRLCNSLTR